MSRQGNTIYIASVVVTVLVLYANGIGVKSTDFWAIIACLIAARTSKSFDDIEW